MGRLRYAWRNLWRNRRRTLITLAAIVVDTAVLIVGYSLIAGQIRQAVRMATGLVVGEVQVHADSYLEDHSLYKAIPDPDSILRAAKGMEMDAAPRVYGYGLVSHGAKSAGALVWGIIPAAERASFDLWKHVDEGDFLSPLPRRHVVLGRKLAHSLQIHVGSEIVLVVQAADGSLGNDVFVVAGVLKLAGDSVDRSAAILHDADFRELFALGDRVHEIALNSRGRYVPAEVAARLRIGQTGTEVKTWRELLPAFADLLSVSRVSIWILGGILFLAGGLGVMNTMLMATFERFPEFGVIKALGASPWRIVGDVVTEAFILGLAATVVGATLGAAGAYALEVVGLDTRSWGGEITVVGVAFDPVWRASVQLRTVISPVLFMWATCILAGLYPAMMAARTDPVKAIHHV